MIMKGKTLRFINFLLDTAIYFLFMLVLLLVFKNSIAQEKVKWISILVYFSYYFIFECINGQTIGKIITRSKVISLTETKDFFYIQILLRTLMRFIPLDMLTYIFSFRGLHDWISKTTVIKL